MTTAIYGGPGADTLKGGYNKDVLVGRAGPDAIYADDEYLKNPDSVFAGDGDDDVFLSEGDGPPVFCGAGADTVHGWVAPRRLVDCEVVLPTP